MKNNLILCCAAGILFGSALGNLNAQTGKSLTQGNQLFTEKVDMSIAGNKDSIYYLLLCKLLPNATSIISGAITIEAASQDSCSNCNICIIEVNVFSDPLSDNNRMVINNQCNVVNALIVSVQYERDEYIAIELSGIMDVDDISFTGYAENKSLLLANENEVEAINDLSNTSRANGSLWEETTNGIYYNGGNVGIGTILPNGKIHVLNASRNYYVNRAISGSTKKKIIEKDLLPVMFVPMVEK